MIEWKSASATNIKVYVHILDSGGVSPGCPQRNCSKQTGGSTSCLTGASASSYKTITGTVCCFLQHVRLQTSKTDSSKLLRLYPANPLVQSLSMWAHVWTRKVTVQSIHRERVSVSVQLIHWAQLKVQEIFTMLCVVGSHFSPSGHRSYIPIISNI